MELNGKKILVVGLARTGVALCRFLAVRRGICLIPSPLMGRHRVGVA